MGWIREATTFHKSSVNTADVHFAYAISPAGSQLRSFMFSLFYERISKGNEAFSLSAEVSGLLRSNSEFQIDVLRTFYDLAKASTTRPQHLLSMNAGFEPHSPKVFVSLSLISLASDDDDDDYKNCHDDEDKEEDTHSAVPLMSLVLCTRPANLNIYPPQLTGQKSSVILEDGRVLEGWTWSPPSNLSKKYTSWYMNIPRDRFLSAVCRGYCHVDNIVRTIVPKA